MDKGEAWEGGAGGGRDFGEGGLEGGEESQVIDSDSRRWDGRVYELGTGEGRGEEDGGYDLFTYLYRIDVRILILINDILIRCICILVLGLLAIR